jgi:hypothetical protein
MWLIGFYLLKFFSINFVLLYDPFDNPLQNIILMMQWCSLSNFSGPKLKFKLKSYLVDFLFESFDIHMMEKRTTCHDCYWFKW